MDENIKETPVENDETIEGGTDAIPVETPIETPADEPVE